MGPLPGARRPRPARGRAGPPLAHDETVAAGVERARRGLGMVVAAGRQGPDDVEGAEGQRAERDLGATRDRGVDLAGPDRTQGLAQRDRRGCARVGGRQDRPVDAERDAEVGRRGAAEDGQGEGRADRADAALEIALVLRLGVGDPAQGAAQVDARSLGLRPSEPTRLETGVGQRQLTRDQAELAEPVELPGGLGVHEAERVEVVDLGRHLRPERARVEPVDPSNRRTAGAQPGAGGLDPDARGRDDAQPGDPDPPFGMLPIEGHVS